MMSETAYDVLIKLLPIKLRETAAFATDRDKQLAEEIRLRCGQELSIVLPGGEKNLTAGGKPVTVQPQDLEYVIELATRSSAYSAVESVRKGYITINGGHRIGLCGSAVVINGEITNLVKLSSISIRIARQIYGVADPLFREYGGNFDSTLIIAPPGCGKTTLLRDLVRQLSNGSGKMRPQRIGLADERGEIAAMQGGMPQMDVGRHTDILNGSPKAEAMLMLLKTMNPTVLACDEITSEGDVFAVEQAANCGVKLLATAHAANMDELKVRPVYQRLLQLHVFRYFAYLSPDGTHGLRVEKGGPEYD